MKNLNLFSLCSENRKTPLYPGSLLCGRLMLFEQWCILEGYEGAVNTFRLPAIAL